MLKQNMKAQRTTRVGTALHSKKKDSAISSSAKVLVMELTRKSGLRPILFTLFSCEVNNCYSRRYFDMLCLLSFDIMHRRCFDIFHIFKGMGVGVSSKKKKIHS